MEAGEIWIEFGGFDASWKFVRVVKAIGSFAVNEENCYEIINTVENNQAFAFKTWVLGSSWESVTNDTVEFVICSEA